jgi:O-antigen ligase
MLSNTRMFKHIYFIGLFLLPFIYGIGLRPYEIPRVWFFDRWVELLIVLLIVTKVSINKKISSSVLLSALIFLVVCVISSFFGVDFPKSFWGNYWRADGLFTLFHLYGLLVLTAFSWQKDWKDSFIKAITYSALLLAILQIISMVLLHFVRIPIYSINGVTGISFGQPNFLAGYLLLSLPFLLHFKFLKSKFNVLTIFLVIVAVCTTLSWAAILGVGIVALLYAVQHRKWQEVAIIILAALLIGYLFLFKTLSQTHYIYEGRTRIAVKAIKAFEARPWLGWGFANFDYAFESVDWPIHINQDVYVDRAHSNLLDILTTTGIFGILSYLGMIIAIFSIFINRVRKNNSIKDVRWTSAIFTIFILYLFHSQTNIISLNEEIYLWLIGGILASNNY